MKKLPGVVLSSAILIVGLIAVFVFPSKNPPSKKPEPASSSSASVDSAPRSSPTINDLSAETPSRPLTGSTSTSLTAPAPAVADAPPAGKVPPNAKALQKAFSAINAAADANTPESLQTLVSYATTENADIRSAALDGMIRRGDVSVAPLLRKAAKQLDDSAAIIDLLKTADYLELPPADMKAIAARPKRPKPVVDGGTPQPAAQPK